MALPAEILDHILSFLGSDTAALKRCSESHPSLCQLAERYLYSRILLTTNNSSDESSQPANLIGLLFKRPYIVHYIRSLEISVRDDRDTETQLEEVSTILPNLSALREITLDHPSGWLDLDWEALPESFRLAFLDCLRLQSMQVVCLKHILRFPYRSALNDECKSIRSLTVRGPSQINNLDLDGPLVNQGLSLCLHISVIHDMEGFVSWFATCRSQLRSLEFFSFDDRCYDSLPRLLANSSNSLTSLVLDLGSARARFYNFNICPIIHDAAENIPVTLSTFPHLEQLTIRAILHYNTKSSIGRGGFYSPIPAIKQLFSSNTLSLRHLILDFRYIITSQDLVQTKSLPWSSLSEVICTALVHLLSTLSAFDFSSAVSIQVDLRLSEVSTLRGDTGDTRAIPLNIIHSFLSGSKELMLFVEQGRLIVTPPIPKSLNINVLDRW